MTSLALQDLLRGRGAHVDPVACLTGLSAAEAGRSLAPNLHTIWQLVWHMNYWMDYELRSIDGPEVPYPEHAEESWPGGTAPADEATWRLELTLFEKQVERLAGWAGHAAVGGLGSRVVHRANRTSESGRARADTDGRGLEYNPGDYPLIVSMSLICSLGKVQ